MYAWGVYFSGSGPSYVPHDNAAYSSVSNPSSVQALIINLFAS